MKAPMHPKIAKYFANRKDGQKIMNILHKLNDIDVEKASDYMYTPPQSSYYIGNIRFFTVI